MIPMGWEATKTPINMGFLAVWAMGRNGNDSHITWVKRSELAQKLGIGRRRVGQLVEKGVFVEVDGKIDLHRAMGAYEDKTDEAKRLAYQQRKQDAKPTKPKAAPKVEVVAKQDTPEPATEPEPAQGQLDFNAAKAKKENWAAERARLVAEEMAGKLLSRDEVASKEFAIGRKIRDRLLGFPAKVANFVPAEAMKIINEEVEVLIKEVQDDVARIAGTAK